MAHRTAAPAASTRSLIAAAAALALACAASKPPGGPVPRAVSPAQATGVAPVEIVIVADALDAGVRTDFADGSGSVEAAFTAALVPQDGGGPVPLEGVALDAARTLRATVPAGLASGTYDLVVTDGAGRSGVLPQAFRVVSSSESVAEIRVDVLEAPRAGVPFAVSLTAVDAAGRVVDGFDGEVAVSDLSGTASPPSVGPFALGRLTAHVTVAALRASDRLEVRDALGHGGSSDPFDVVAGPAVAAAFPSPPVSAASGACSPAVEVELRDSLAHPALAEQPIPAALQSAPPGTAFFADGACATPISGVIFAAGASRAAFHFRAAAPGTVALRVVPSTLPSAVRSTEVSP
jgi:hypothetical protein